MWPKDISHQTLRSNSYGKLQGFDRGGWNEILFGKFVFRLPFLLSVINQKSGDENNINTWHKEQCFIPNQKTNFTGFKTADLRFCLTYKMASWSPKMLILEYAALCIYPFMSLVLDNVIWGGVVHVLDST